MGLSLQEFYKDHAKFIEQVDTFHKELKTVYLYAIEDSNNLECGLKARSVTDI